MCGMNPVAVYGTSVSIDPAGPRMNDLVDPPTSYTYSNHSQILYQKGGSYPDDKPLKGLFRYLEPYRFRLDLLFDGEV